MDYKSLKGLILKELKVDWNCSNKLIKTLVLNKGYLGEFSRDDKFTDNELKSIARFFNLIAIQAPKIVKKKVTKYKQRFKSDDRFYNSQAWKEVRYFVLKRDGRRCVCCGATPEDLVKMHVDHIKPRSIRPDLEVDPNNLQVLCEDCNVGKSNKDDTDWRFKIIDDISNYH
jgi:hypothetical protein